jgi:hypothetical protein
MAMAITVRMVARFFFSPSRSHKRHCHSLHYTHIKRIPKSRCAICSGCEDTAKMSPRSRGTCLGDLAGDPCSMEIQPTPGLATGRCNIQHKLIYQNQNAEGALLTIVDGPSVFVGICRSGSVKCPWNVASGRKPTKLEMEMRSFPRNRPLHHRRAAWSAEMRRVCLAA